MPVRIFDERELSLLKEVLDSGNLSSLGAGPMTRRFEREFAAAVGGKHGVAMNCAMSVLHASLMVAGAGAGDEVICDPFCVFGAQACLYANAIPVFVDINPKTWNMDPTKIEEKITKRTKALIVTHTWGLAAEMEAIVQTAHKHNLLVIEDCAHSLYATYKGKYTGTWGDIGSFSFQMSKQLALGDAGMAVTNSDELAKKLNLHAGAPTFTAVAHGLHYNYRSNELTAAVGIGQLERSRGYIDELVEIAGYYDEVVNNCEWLELQRGPAESTHTFHLWGSTFWGDRSGVSLDDLKNALSEAQCGVSVGYTNIPAYKHPVIAERAAHAFSCPTYEGDMDQYPDGLCPVAEEIIPRTVNAYTFGPKDRHRVNAEKFAQAVSKL
ncbi:DegT/DnrJ/EryC1/StrS family aminotransferase [Candidatus Poribacteria bacterium]